MQFTRKIVFSLLIIVLCSALAFASDDSPSPEQAPLEVDEAPSQFAVDLELGRIYETASDIKAATATDYTTTDIYNLLYAALRGRSSSSTYSLVSMNSDIRNIYQDLSGFLSPSVGASPLYALQDIHSILSGTALGLNPISNIMDSLQIVVGDQSYSQAELTGMIWSLVQDLESNTSLSNGYLSSISSGLNTINTSISGLESFNWTSFGSYVGTSLDLDTNFISQSGYHASIYSAFRIVTSSDRPFVIRLGIPYRPILSDSSNSLFTLDDIYVYRNGSFSKVQFSDNYFFEVSNGGIYLYLFDFNNYYAGVDYYFHISHISGYYNSSLVPSISYIPFDTVDYQLLKSAFYQSKATDNLSSIYSNVADLSNYFVSPEKQAAEQSSQQVIDSTLDNFTGNGSGAAKSSDSNAMKDVSGSLQSGLNSGGSVSGATGVFNSGSDFWGWFSQQNSNYINNPYPAPVVSPTRGTGDEIVDFLTPNSNELQDLLRQGGDQR